jgi:hypothetical protein
MKEIGIERAGSMGVVVEHLPNKYRALRSNPTIAKKKELI